MAISAGDLALLRGQDIIIPPHLNVIPKVEVGTGQIAQAPAYFPRGTYKVDNLSFNGGVDLTNLDLGLMIWIGTSAGLHDVMVSTIRLHGVADQIYIHGHSEGDPGVKMAEHTAVANNHHFTIFANSPLWAQLSRISGGTFYKKYNVAYGDEGSDPNPVCNVGKWRRVVLSGGQVDVALTAANSYYHDKAAASWAWSYRNSSYALDGAGGAWQTAQNIVNPTVRFTTGGFYIVRCEITDNNGETHIAETNIWVVDPDNNTVDLGGWRVESDSQNRQGRKMTIRMYGDVAESTVFPGAGFLYTETSTYAGSSLTDGAVVDTFVGYIDEEAGIRTVGYGEVEFDLISPAHVLDQLPMAPQYIQEVSSPSNWTEVDSGLSHPTGVAWYILAHHAPNMLKKFDFNELGDTDLRDHNWVLNKNSVWGQLGELCPQQINVGCVSEGALYLRHDPLLMDAADRNALDVRLTWTGQDIRGDDGLEYPDGYRLDVGQVDAYAFSYNGTSSIAYWSRAPGDVQSIGKQKQTNNGLVVAQSGGQARLNEISGHLFAKANNPTPALKIPAKRAFDTADPALMVWHQLTIPDALDPRGSGYTERRFLPLSVSRRWQQVNGSWLKSVDITMEEETTGVDGITKPIPAGVGGSWFPGLDWPDLGGFDSLSIPDEAERTTPTYVIVFHRNSAKVALGVAAGGLGAGAPTYTDISTGLAGDCRWASADPFNYQRYYCVTTSGLFRCDNVFATTPIWTQMLDNSLLNNTNWNNYHQIVMSGHRQGWIMLGASFYDIHVSFDYGLNWNVYEYSSGADTSDDQYLINLDPGAHNVIDGTSYCYGFTGGLVIESDDWGLTWSYLSNPDVNSNSNGFITTPFIRGGGVDANIPDASQELYAIDGWRNSAFPNRAWWAFTSINRAAAWVAFLNGVGVGSWDSSWASPSMRPMTVFTLDGDKFFIVEQSVGQVNRDARVAYSRDGGTTVTACANQPGLNGPLNLHTVGVNGWPYNEDFCVCWWERTTGGIVGGLEATEDAGATAWQDLTGNLVSGGIFGDMRIAYAEAVLGAIQ